MTTHFTRRGIVARRTLRDFECLCRHIDDRCERAPGDALAITTVAVEHRDRSGSDFVANRAAGASAGKRRGQFLSYRCAQPSWPPQDRQNAFPMLREL